MSRKHWEFGEWFLLSFCILGFLFLCSERARGAVSLASYKKELAQPGEAVSAQDFKRSAPQGFNGLQASVPAPKARSNSPLRVLILSGQNNHDWRETTPRLRTILENEGRFAVEITEQPEHLTSAALKPYDVLLSNWNTFDSPAVTNWPAATREAFLAFIRNGKGIAIVHAGSSSFYDWPEYHQLTGAAWKLGQTGHGARHQFAVQALDPAHPITRGMTNFTTFDELWHSAGLQASVHILATAFSDPASGGSGKNEPVALVTEFGRGRCFTLLLGHDARAMDALGFQSLLRRGVEWAATEEVAEPNQTKGR